jgi:hypothetical protein
LRAKRRGADGASLRRCGFSSNGITLGKAYAVGLEPFAIAAGIAMQQPALERDRSPWEVSASELGPAGTASWGHFYALRATRAAEAEHEFASARRRRATASAGGTLVILSSVALLATSLIAETESGNSLLVSVHDAAVPGLAFEHARPLLIVATALSIATVSTSVMLAVLTPSRKVARRLHGLPAPNPRPVRAQRHRVAVVLGAGVAPVLIGGALPFLGHLLPIGIRIDASSAVGSNLLDVVIGLAVPATLLSVLFFRWVARLASADTPDAEHG